jgi:hypothetical protein
MCMCMALSWTGRYTGAVCNTACCEAPTPSLVLVDTLPRKRCCCRANALRAAVLAACLVRRRTTRHELEPSPTPHGTNRCCKKGVGRRGNGHGAKIPRGCPGAPRSSQPLSTWPWPTTTPLPARLLACSPASLLLLLLLRSCLHALRSAATRSSLHQPWDKKETLLLACGACGVHASMHHTCAASYGHAAAPVQRAHPAPPPPSPRLSPPQTPTPSAHGTFRSQVQAHTRARARTHTHTQRPL